MTKKMKKLVTFLSVGLLSLGLHGSPDLTHFRVVKAGDTLPLMAQQHYGAPGFVGLVVAANNLKNFRTLKVGQELYFPPINKSN